MFFDKPTGRYRLTPTELSSFLSCHHRAALKMSVAKKKIQRPKYDDPQLEALFQRGLDHEAEHVEGLRKDGLSNIVSLAEIKDREESIAKTIEAIRNGADVIVKGALGNECWYGRPDILKKVASAIADQWVAEDGLASEQRHRDSLIRVASRVAPHP